MHTQKCKATHKTPLFDGQYVKVYLNHEKQMNNFEILIYHISYPSTRKYQMSKSDISCVCRASRDPERGKHKFINQDSSLRLWLLSSWVSLICVSAISAYDVVSLVLAKAVAVSRKGSENTADFCSFETFHLQLQCRNLLRN